MNSKIQDSDFARPACIADFSLLNKIASILQSFNFTFFDYHIWIDVFVVGDILLLQVKNFLVILVFCKLNCQLCGACSF